MYEAIGFLGVLLLEFSMVPQIVKTLQTKKVDDISLSFLALLCIGLSLLLTYSMLTSDIVFTLGNFFSLVFALMELVLVWKWKK